MAAISLSPRLPIGTIPGERRLDLRVEDILLVFLLAAWFPYGTLRRVFEITPLGKPLGWYVGLSLFCTGVAIVVGELDPVRAVFYMGKEVEYFFIFLVVANWVRSAKEVTVGAAFLVVGGLINAVWVVDQVLTGSTGTFFETPDTVSYMGGAVRAYSYGPTLVGEISPLSTGGFFLVIFFLILGLTAMSRRAYQRAILFALGALVAGAAFSSLSRVSIFGGIAGVAIVLVFSEKKLFFKWIIPIGCAVVLVSSYLMGALRSSERVFDWEGFWYGFVEGRLELIWQPLLTAMERGMGTILFGFGKSSLGFVRELPFEEAHNFYLRIFLEMGVLGPLAFIWILVCVIRLSRNLYKDAKLGISRAVGLATMGATIALSLGALAQDVFVAVKVMEPFWFLVGLAAAAQRLETHVKAGRPVAARERSSDASTMREGVARHGPEPRRAFRFHYHPFQK